ncbi:MAG TPA: TetR/AcrR family transcriptional regulator C-terminal domain-containing protein [Acidimicrobiales bacterium]
MPPRMRAGLTRQRVLRSALDLVDREGVDALTMRRLGRELGVEAMSLYSYVESKQDLVEGVVEQVFKEMPLIRPGLGPWQQRLRIHAATYRAVLLRHPNAVRLVAGRPLITDGTMAFVESALVELRSIGLGLITADRVLDVLASFIIGHVSEQVGDVARRAATEADGAPAGAVAPDPVRYPNVAGVAAAPPADPDDEFAFGLEFVITGIERLLSEAPGEATA